MSEAKIKESIKYPHPESALFKGDSWIEIGRSAGGHSISARRINGKSNKRILLIGGVHGNETEGVAFMVGFCNEMADVSTYDHELFLIPVANPDGFLSYERKNSNGVDLNRNLPTKDWSPEAAEDKYHPGPAAGSEPENQALIRVIEDYKPDYIIPFHSWKPMINVNGPAKPFAEKMQKYLKMPIVDDIGYPTPGSLGTYTGWEKNIPTITLEFERGISLETVYQQAKQGIITSFDAL